MATTNKRRYSKADSEQMVADASQKILDAFETGNVPKALAQIFIQRAGRHADSYSWSNQLIVALSGYSDAMGFGSEKHNSGWLSVGRRVRKGQKATYILAPCLITITDKDTGDKIKVPKGFRPTPVFGIEQTDVVDADKWAKHNKANEESDKFLAELPLREVADAWGLTVQAYSGKAHGAHGWYRHGEAIAVGVKNLSTWAHELVHAADDKNGKLTKGKPGQKFDNEVVAEFGGAILLYACGYETDADMGGAYKYIQSYAKRNGSDDVFKACNQFLKRTCEAVKLILDTAAELAAPLESDTAMTPATEGAVDMALA